MQRESRLQIGEEERGRGEQANRLHLFTEFTHEFGLRPLLVKLSES